MTREEAIEILKGGELNPCVTEDREACEMAIKALEQEPSEDCIRRAKALKVIKQMDIPKDMSVFEIKSHMSVGIFTLPPVTSTRMKGKWINILPCTTNFQDQIIYQCVCDRCSSIAYFRKMCGKLVGANLCPVCGAEMQEVEE